MIVGVTGHRPDKLGSEYQYQGPYSDYIKTSFNKFLSENQIQQAISGMAIGVDTLFAETILEHNISLIAAIPFLGQEKRWPNESQERYRKILKNPLVKSVVVCEGEYANWKMQKRNEYIVDNCDLLIAVWNGTKGGTFNTIKYARSVNRKIEYIQPDSWKKLTTTSNLWE